MQRFLDIQEGTNVLQPFDSVDVRYTHSEWQANAFYGRPVLIREVRPFHDTSMNGFTLSGERLERRNLGHGNLSFFAARFRALTPFTCQPLGANVATSSRRTTQAGLVGIGTWRAWGSRAAWETRESARGEPVNCFASPIEAEKSEKSFKEKN
jgi:hypothetical protein